MSFPCTRSISQCQLTCKNWSTLARYKLYTCLILKTPRQLNLIIDLNSHLKDLVHHIRVDNRYTHDDVITAFNEIDLHFTELKSVYSDNRHCRDVIWKVVKSERPRGRFSKLQVIPLMHPETYNDIVQYNHVAWSLRNTLRELEVYFTSLEVVHFYLNNHVYKIEQQLKESGSLRSVNMTYDERTPVYDELEKIYPNVQVLPQVKQLEIRGFPYDCDMYPYVMQVFSNLDIIRLPVIDSEQAGTVPPLSTEVAPQFVRYLLRIASVSVTYIPFKNLEQVMMEFYNRERIIKRFTVQYHNNMKDARCSSYISVSDNVKYGMYIDVNYAKESSRIILPRVGMIEHNGDNFQDITMNMGFDFDDIELLAVSSTQEDGLYLQQQNISFVRRLRSNSSLAYGSFLLDMSFHLPFIDEFVVTRCRFDGENEKNITIDMSGTTFTDIVYNGDYNFIVKVYLKLATLENNTSSWLAVKNNQFNTCTENEYQNSLQNTKIISLFIQCKQIDSFSFRANIFRFVVRIGLK
ncbi:hypothetical protein EDC94DRAFT_656283 [Helicostylum pulchrum]|nr:hypothetical protein EDC94DRAFT_656283 [Helicostylum pulchrum]